MKERPKNHRRLVNIFFLIFTLIFSLPCSNILAYNGNNFSVGSEEAKLYGVHQIELEGKQVSKNPFNIDCKINVIPPSGNINKIEIDSFYNGNDIWKARIYVNEVGLWRWHSKSSGCKSLDKTGTFKSINSNLCGILRKHRQNNRHWQTDNGQWFLNISDTAYLLFDRSQTEWQKYIENIWELGITSVRVGSLGGFEWDKGEYRNSFSWQKLKFQKIKIYSNYPWVNDLNQKFNLKKFQETDSRLIWMLNNYPELYIQLILFGLKSWAKDDTGLAWKALPIEVRKKTMRYMLARWAAFPQIFWLVVNDIHCSEEFPNNMDFVREVGNYLHINDPWHHPISAGPNRKAEFPFLTEKDKWVTYIHLEDEYQLEADLIEFYAPSNLPLFLAEDRYEQDYYTKDPIHPQYYYRCLFWSWLLSGGSANYGGRWRDMHPYFETKDIPYFTNSYSEKDRHTYKKRLKGLDSIKFIKQFFAEQEIELWRFQPNHNKVSDLNGDKNRRRPKLMEHGNKEFIIYHPNSEINGRRANRLKDERIRIMIDLTDSKSIYEVIWYRPFDGKYYNNEQITGGKKVTFISPEKGFDMVLLLRKSNGISDIY